MKKFIRTLKQLSERAAQFQETLQQVPPKVAEIRQAVSLTSGQLRQLQADVQMNVASLKADNPDRLVDALHEINGSNEVFQEAGYELGHVEMELSPVPRLIVHLDRVEDTRDSVLQALSEANRERRITQALLNAVIQAEAVADRVDIQGQVYYRLIVHVGPVPSVKLGWMPEPAMSRQAAVLPAPSAGPPPLTTDAGAPKNSFSYGKSSFFESGPSTAAAPRGSQGPPEAPPSPAAPSAEESASPPTVPQPVVQNVSAANLTAQTPSQKDWGKSALERFKQMPTASKYRR
jgi:hypothetical protein